MGESIEHGPEGPEGRPERAPEIECTYNVVFGIRPHDPKTFVETWARDNKPLARKIYGVELVELFKVDEGSLGSLQPLAWSYVMTLGWPSKEAHDASMGSPARDAALEHIKTLGEIDVVFRVEEIITEG